MMHTFAWYCDPLSWSLISVDYVLSCAEYLGAEYWLSNNVDILYCEDIYHHLWIHFLHNRKKDSGYIANWRQLGSDSSS